MTRFSKGRILVFIIACWLILTPLRAQSGLEIVQLLNSITTTLQNSIGQVLGGIRSITTRVRDFEQQAVWPLTAINQAKAFVGQLRAQYASLAAQIHAIEVSSAVLASPSQLESLLRSHTAANFGQINGSYAKVYQSLPLPGQATPEQRNLIDVDDAMALGALKTATVGDQATAQMLSVADGLEQQAATSAPGAMSILTAQAQASNLQSQAMLQRMLAAELRQEAARLAHQNALRKQRADRTRDLRNNLQQILSRP
jgi:hypothetical protein